MTSRDLSSLHFDYENLKGSTDDSDEEELDEHDRQNLLINTNRRDAYGGGLTSSQSNLIRDLLGEWEEPSTDERKVESASISAVVQFRAAASCLDTKYPFTHAFGLADSRENCIDSSQKLFLRLCKANPSSGILKFDTIALVAAGKKSEKLDEAVIRDLIGVFRPTRTGELTMLEFVKSVDTVYKDLRVLRASIVNAKKMNSASQRIMDIAFYFVISCIVLPGLGVDPIALFGGLTTLVVGIAFMIGGASSTYFEGLILILVRKPYDIGDRIAISGVEDDVCDTGSAGWIVKDLDLSSTTVIFATTGEEATYSNGSLASSRIINHNRSPKAMVNFPMKFSIETSKDTIATFVKALKQYVKERPREWLSFSACRLVGVDPDDGSVEYNIMLQHRESWQQIGALLTSKADVQLYACELSREMSMMKE